MMTNEQTATRASFWRGALAGFLFTALGSIVTAYLQHIFSLQEKGNQLFLDEKKDFVSACQVYLTQYRNWYSLMNYYTYRTAPGPSNLMEFDSLSIRPAYTTWRKDFDVAYGNLFLVTNNEFGITTMQVSDSLARTLSAVMTPGQLTQPQKERLFGHTNTYFLREWLAGAQREIFQYNTGERRQKSLAEFQAEQQALALRQADSVQRDDQLYAAWKKLVAPRLRQDSATGQPARLPSREEFGRMMHPGR